MAITSKQVRETTGNRYAKRLAQLQVERADIYARERRADEVIASVPAEFRACFRAAVEGKRALFDEKCRRWQQAVDLDPAFWGQMVDGSTDAIVVQMFSPESTTEERAAALGLALVR